MTRGLGKLPGTLAQQVYDRLPGVRPVFASALGYWLRNLRYNEDTEILVEEALERDRWDFHQWKYWQEDRVVRMLETAATRVPYYREMWKKRRERGDYRSWAVLENWPILEKEEIRAHGRQLIHEDTEPRKLRCETTSGTTGSPVQFWFSRDTIRIWYAISEARWRVWNGISRYDRWALFGARPVAPQSQSSPPYWVFSQGLNQLYLSTYHLSPESSESYLDALLKYKVEYLLGHSSALYCLAAAAIRARRRVPLRTVLTQAEPLLKYQRQTIEQAFGVPVRETYGMSEMTAAASECTHGRMHLWPDIAHYEVVRGKERVAPGELGDLVCTSLIHDSMMLVRYRVGDLARLPEVHTPCACGRGLPVLEALEGRSGDMLVGTGGNQISPTAMEAVFDTDLKIYEGQLIQESATGIRVRYVPLDGFNEKDCALLRQRIRERMGDVDVVFERTGSIPRTAAGKFQAVRYQGSRSEGGPAVPTAALSESRLRPAAP